MSSSPHSAQPAFSVFRIPGPGDSATEAHVTVLSGSILRLRVAHPEGPARTPLSAVIKSPRPLSSPARLHVEVEGAALIVRLETGRVLLRQTHVDFGSSDINGVAFRSVRVKWESASPDSLHGLGAFQDERINLRGRTLACHQRNMEDTVPMLFSTSGFGLFWDNPAPFIFEAGGDTPEFAIQSRTGGVADYYVIAGDTPDEIIAGYRELTGHAPLFPKWAFGYHQSKERYQSQAEIVEVARRFRETGLPLDLMIQDWQYWRDSTWNDLRFDPARYPDPRAMIETLHRDDVRCLVVVWPCFPDGDQSDINQGMSALGALSPHVRYWRNLRYYDPFNERARELLWAHARRLFALGFDGWWLDAVEPAIGKKEGQSADEVFLFGATCAAGPFPALANAYPYYAAEAFREGQQRDGATKRFFALVRSVYAGSQRQGVCYWTGDVAGTWESFRRQIAACLGMSAAGIPYVSADIGGFAVSYPGGAANEEYRELYVRWFQFGALSPEFRAHGASTPREPWQFGQPGEETYEALADFLRLRYRLLPYLYSLSWRVTFEGYTLMRPLAMEFFDQPALANVSDQYLLGPSLLVAPVVQPLLARFTRVPADVMLDSEQKPGALTGDYYREAQPHTPVLSRRDPGIAFRWEKKPRVGMGEDPALDPIEGLDGMNHFVVRWRGYVRITRSGTHGFRITADQEFRFTVGDLLLTSRSKPDETGPVLGSIELTAGQLVSLQLEYRHTTGQPHVELAWSTPSAEPPLRPVLLPAGSAWHDFWNGERHEGGRVVAVPAPLSRCPLFVREGSILPLGPESSHAHAPWDPCELRVYPGKDAALDLYDDEGDGHGYTAGARQLVPLRWDDSTRRLRFGAAQGTFPGAPAVRRFIVRLLDSTGVFQEQIVRYRGEATSVAFPP